MEQITVRKRIHTIVEKAQGNDPISRIYDLFISLVAVASLVPLMFREQSPLLDKIDTITVYILFLDYILRWMTYDFTRKKKSWWVFLIYPITPYALIDLISILPSLGVLGQSFRILRMLRFVKVLHYSKSFQYIANTIKNERRTLLSVLVIAVAYICVSALAMFSHEGEKETFDTFFDALYWATTALTTVGYGDVYPHTDLGRLISMISSLFGIAIIALPAGIVTGGYIEQINNAKNQEQRQESLPPARRLPRAVLARFAAVAALGIVLNELCYTLVSDLPLWLDMVGTCYASLIMGPAAGLMVGLANNFYLALSSFGNGSIIYYAASACAALLVGCLLGPGRKITWKRGAAVGALTAAATALISFAVTMLTLSGVPDAPWELSLYQSALAAGVPGWLGCLFSAAAVKAMDGVVTGLLLWGLYKATRFWESRHAPA